MNPLDPKAAEGAKKTQLHLLPPVALAEAAKAHRQGSERYGPYNWRNTKVCASTYISAMMRHLDLWRDGEDLASDSGISHLGHIIASANILLDAAHCGTLVDDRAKVPDQTGRFRGVLVNPDYKDAEDFAVPTGMNGVQPQYRVLQAGEALEAGDELMGARIHGGEFFMPITAEAVGTQLTYGNVGFYRRPLP